MVGNVKVEEVHSLSEEVLGDPLLQAELARLGDLNGAPAVLSFGDVASPCFDVVHEFQGDTGDYQEPREPMVSLDDGEFTP